MKLKLFFLLVIISITVKSQVYVQVAIDPKMAIDGPYENSTAGALDLIIRVADKSKYSEFGLQAEIFTALKPSYYSYGVFYNRIITLNKHEIYAGAEFNLLMRKLERSTAGFLSVGANTGYRFNFKRFALGVEANYKTRPDFKGLWNSNKNGVFSNYITFTYKFKKL